MQKGNFVGVFKLFDNETRDYNNDKVLYFFFCICAPRLSFSFKLKRSVSGAQRPPFGIDNFNNIGVTHMDTRK